MQELIDGICNILQSSGAHQKAKTARERNDIFHTIASTRDWFKGRHVLFIFGNLSVERDITPEIVRSLRHLMASRCAAVVFASDNKDWHYDCMWDQGGYVTLNRISDSAQSTYIRGCTRVGWGFPSGLHELSYHIAMIRKITTGYHFLQVVHPFSTAFSSRWEVFPNRVEISMFVDTDVEKKVIQDHAMSDILPSDTHLSASEKVLIQDPTVPDIAF